MLCLSEYKVVFSADITFARFGEARIYLREVLVLNREAHVRRTLCLCCAVLEDVIRITARLEDIIIVGFSLYGLRLDRRRSRSRGIGLSREGGL